MPILTANERVGTEIGGRYRLSRILGEGGFSAVFLAEHLMTGRGVALKLLHAHLVQTEQVSRRFLIEAQAMAKVRHPGIVQVLDAGREADGTIFIALELLEGETLEEMLARSRRIGVHTAVQLATDVLDALSAAHGHGIIHRDIKPANIYLAHEPGGRIRSKVLDFGIAHVAQKGAADTNAAPGARLTSAGVILGTPEYMSPEQGRGGAIGAAADIWSVGILLYEMLAGDVPWTNDSATALLMAVATQPLPDIRARAPGLPEPLVAVINHSLEKDPAKRPASAAEMRVALAAAMCEAREDPSGAFAAIVGPAAGAGSKRGLATPTPGPHARSVLPAMLPDPPLPAPAPAPAVAVPPAATVPRTTLRAVRAGLGREFEFDGADDQHISLDLGTADPVSSRTGMSTGRMPAVSPRASARPPPPSAELDGLVDLPLPPEPAVAHTTGRNPAMSIPPRASLAPPAASPESLRNTGKSATLPAPPARRSVPPPAAPAGGTPRSNTNSAADSFARPPPRNAALGLGVALAVVASGVVAAGMLWARRDRHVAPPAAREPDGAHALQDAPAPDVVVARPRPANAFELSSRYTIAPPYGMDADAQRSFARHMSLGPGHTGRTLRTIGTCSRRTVYLFTAADGLPAGSSPADIACEHHDLAVVGDVDGDGTDDVAAVSQNHDAVVFLLAPGLRTSRFVPVPRVEGLVGAVIRGESVVLAYAEPDGPGGGTEVLAIASRTGQVLWRVAGRAPFVRFGNPSELGLASGPDATGDGVEDVVVGSTVAPGTAADTAPARPRCVELISGATGERAWPEPFCQQRGGSQSVALGLDASGDQRADIAVGTDVVRGADPHVVLISGADARILRRITPTEACGPRSFGWPVALGPDMDQDGSPELLVGSVGSEGTIISVFGASDGALRAARQVPGDAAFPNVRVALGVGLLHGDASAAVVSSPQGGFYVYTLVPAGP